MTDDIARPGYSIAIYAERILEIWPIPEDAQARLRELGPLYDRPLIHMAPDGRVLGVVNAPIAETAAFWRDVRRRNHEIATQKLIDAAHAAADELNAQMETVS